MIEKLSIVSKIPTDPEYLTDIEIFNKLMFEYAKIGKTTKINLLFRKMHLISTESNQSKLMPNLNSYVAGLQSLGYELDKSIDDKSKISKIKLQTERLLWDMKKAGFSLESLSKSNLFSSEQQNHIKLALNLIIQDFGFKNCVDLSATNPIFKALKYNNHEHIQMQNENKKEKKYSKEIIKKDIVMKNFDEQINFEAKTFVRVPSIIPIKENHQIKRIEQLREKVLLEFREKITRSLIKKIELLSVSDKFHDLLIYPFLTFMDHSIYVDLLIQEVIRLSQNSKYYSENFKDISVNLGSVLEAKYQHFVMNKNGDINKV